MIKKRFFFFIPFLLFFVRNSLYNILFAQNNSLGYLGILICVSLSCLGVAKALSCISKSVSGSSVLVPRVGTRAFFGIVMCEANFLMGVLMCFSLFSRLPSLPNEKVVEINQLYFAAGVVVGMCSYSSSIATGIICSSITIMDAKNPSLFFRLVIMELLSSAIGVLGFVFGFIMINKSF